jgi:hypothetical protein
LSQNVHISTWEEFKNTVKQTNSNALIFVVEAYGFVKPKEFTALRVILSADKSYIYLDFPKGDNLRQTGIAIRTCKDGTRYLDEEDVKAFLHKEFGEKMEIYSWWTT